MTISDAIIVGGGVAGCAAALELARQKVDVTLIERDHFGGNASNYSWGGLYPSSGTGIPGPLQSPAKHSLNLHVTLAQELREMAGVDVRLRQVESIQLAADDEELAQLQDQCVWQKATGFDSEIVSPEDLQRIAPELNFLPVGGLLQRSHYELDSSTFTHGLASRAKQLGANIFAGNVVRVDGSGTSVSVTTQKGDLLSAGALVIATGPQAGLIEVEGLPQMPLRPVKGEILRLRVPGNRFERRLGMGTINAGRKPDGLVWVGTTEENVYENEAPSESGAYMILDMAARYTSMLRNAPIEHHTACLRPVSRDGLPIVGPLALYPPIYAMCGGGKKGVLLSLVMAEWLAATIIGSRDRQPPAAVLPSRFGM